MREEQLNQLQQHQPQLKIAPQINRSKLHEMVTITDEVVTVKAGSGSWYSIYLEQPIGDEQSFRVRVVDDASERRFFMIGVGISDQALAGNNIAASENCVCLNGQGLLLSDGTAN